MLSLLLAGLLVVPGQAQFGLLGRSVARGTPVLGTPCDLQTGCVAAHSLARRVVAAYSGNLFQLSRTGGGGGTQNIGQTGAHIADTAAVATFCGTVSGTFGATTTTNGCKVAAVRDQSGNGNDLIAVGCDTPYAVNASGVPVLVGVNGCYFNTASPSGTPTGNANASIVVVGNDVGVNARSDSSDYALDYGLLHAVAVPNGLGVSFDLMLRGGNVLPGNALTFGVDLEDDVAELVYGVSDAGSTAYTNPTLAALSNVGDFVGTASYDTGTTNIVMDFNNGQQTYTVPFGSMNMGGAAPAQIRVLASGDGTWTGAGTFYEGLIYAQTLTLPQQRQLATNAQTFFQITPAPTTCPSGVTVADLGVAPTAAYGLRRINPTRRGPIVGLVRTDGAFKAIGSVAGTCDFDVATAATFCNASVCHLYQWWNQGVSIASHLAPWGNGTGTDGLVWTAASTTAGPLLTFTCLGSFACLDFTGSLALGTNGTQGLTRPLSILAVALNKNSAAFGEVFGCCAANAVFLGGAGSANTLLFQMLGTGTLTTTVADNAWHALAAMVPTNTSLVTCSNGVCTTSGAVTTADQTTIQWRTGDVSFSGYLEELYVINGTAISTTVAATMSTGQRASWGF